MGYKVGDKVKIKDNLSGRRSQFEGRVFTICGVGSELFRVKETPLLWALDDIKCLVEEETSNKYEKHKEICDKLNELYISKDREYGDSFGKAYKRLGKTSAITQIYHKFERVLEIYDKENIKYESLEDNLIDIANYIIMLLTELELDR